MDAMIQVTGEVEFLVKHKDGSQLKVAGPNLVTNEGQALIAKLIAGTGSEPSHMACGSSNETTNKDHVGLLGVEHERVPVLVTAIENVLTIEATFGEGIVGSKTVGEFGIFNSDTAGVMLARWSSVIFTLPDTSTIDVTWRLTIGS